MPTALVIKGYRFFFFSNEKNEPPHVHVTSQGRIAKFWLRDGLLASSKGFADHEIGEISRHVSAHRNRLIDSWRESTLDVEAAFLIRAHVTDAYLEVELSDGRRIATPMSWYPVLQRASRDERETMEVQPWGVHWPLLDEDLSLAGMLAGTPSVEPNAPVQGE